MTIPNSVKSAFTHLKASSNSIVFDALVVIRKFIAKHEDNVKVIREKKVLKELVAILSKPNEKNLDITLSILGNCCLENESRYELLHLGVVKAVVTVFNSSCRDTIQGRACRVIGNLALTYNIAIKLHKENVINGLVNVVDCGGNNSIASQQMAVRALRILWVVESERVSMLELNVVRKVALLLTTPYEKKEQKELLKTVVKALTVFTHRCCEQCAVQVHSDGSVLQSLLSYCAKDEIKSSVVMCVYNLCHIGSSRPILGTAGAVKLIINELSVLALQPGEPSEIQAALMSSLCLLCRESVNRAKIRRAGGLPIILSILRDCPKLSLQSTALHALVSFLYDEVSLQELLKDGLVNVLVAKLNEFIEKHGSEHEQERPKEVKNDQGVAKKRHISLSVCCSGTKNKSENESINIVKTSGKGRDCENKLLESSHVSDTSTNGESWKRFRVSSPSYQAVVQEFGSSQRCKDKTGSSVITSPSHAGEYLYRMNSPEQTMGSDTYQVGEWSPGSPRSMCFSPGSSPLYGRQWNYSPISMQTSPFDMWSATSSPASYSSVDCDIPEVYSPVCHDAQSEEEDCTDVDKCECQRSQDSDELSEEHTVASPSIKFDSPSTNWEVLSNASSSGIQLSLSSGEASDLLILISRISHMETMVEDLVLKNTLSTLLKYIRLLRYPLPRAGRILGRIVRTHHYFNHLVCQQFVLNIHASLCQPLHHSCAPCDKLNTTGKNLISKLSIVAESGFGEGELSHNLLKAEKSTKEIVAVTIPFLIKSHKTLRKLLVDCKGLNILQSLLKSTAENKGFLLECIPLCLSVLAASLKISSSAGTNSLDHQLCSTNDYDAIFQVVDPNDSVTFILDNGDTVTANKTFLSEHSPVFQAMLQGNFKESIQKSIPLADISSNAFKHLLCIMKLGKIPHCLPNVSLSSALELLLLLDKFLVPGSTELSEMIVNQFLQSSTACEVYSKAAEYHGILKVFNDIRIKTIEYLLVSEMSVTKRRDLFDELMKAPCSSQVQNDVFKILYEKLSRKCISC